MLAHPLFLYLISHGLINIPPNEPFYEYCKSIQASNHGVYLVGVLQCPHNTEWQSSFLWNKALFLGMFIVLQPIRCTMKPLATKMIDVTVRSAATVYPIGFLFQHNRHSRNISSVYDFLSFTVKYFHLLQNHTFKKSSQSCEKYQNGY